MEEFEYVATHYGLEDQSFYKAEYMVDVDGRIIAYNLDKEGFWKDADPVANPYQVFPKVSDLFVKERPNVLREEVAEITEQQWESLE